MIQGKPLRAALWTTALSLGMLAAMAIWNPETTRARALTERSAAAEARGDGPKADKPIATATADVTAPSNAAQAATRPVRQRVSGGDGADAGATASVTKTAIVPHEPQAESAGPGMTSASPPAAPPATKPAESQVTARMPVVAESAGTGGAHSSPREGEVSVQASVAPQAVPTGRGAAVQEAASRRPVAITTLAPVGEPPITALAAVTKPLESKLVNLQERVDQLAQATTKQQTDALERTMQLLQQLQQAQQSMKLDTLQQQVEKLQEAPAEKEKSEGEDAAEGAAEPKGGGPEPVLKAQPSGGDDEAFSLQIQDAEITQVLEMLGQLSGTNILAGRDVKGKISANLQDVTVDRALDAILRSAGYVHEREGDFIYVMSPAEAEQRKQMGRKIVTKIYRPHYISVLDLKDLIVPLQTPAPIGKIAFTTASEVGIPNDNENAGGNRLSQGDALLVQDYEEVIHEVDAVVAEMDVPPLQVHIEALILSVKLEEDMKLGVNFALLHDDSNQLLLTGNGQQINNSTGFPGVGGALVPPMGDFIANTAGLKYGFLRGDIAGFVEAIERITDANVVAAPQLRVLNKQRAQLLIGKRLSYKTLAFQDNQTVESANFLDTGTQLILRPFIAPDGLIRMEVHPEKSSGSINQSTGLPDVDTTEVTTNVMVRDGTTVVIGGLIVEESEDETSRVPVLGAVPVVGNLFRNRTTDVRRNEIIVLITPRIVSEPADAEEGETVLAESAARAEYFRNHLSPINRHSLARMCYERALAKRERGELEDALSWAEKALYHSPNELEYLRLRDAIELEISSKRRKWFMGPKGAPAPRPIEPEPLPNAKPDENFKKEDLPPLPSVPAAADESETGKPAHP